jgi:hypothetical protein
VYDDTKDNGFLIFRRNMKPQLVDKRMDLLMWNLLIFMMIDASSSTGTLSVTAEQLHALVKPHWTLSAVRKAIKRLGEPTRRRRAYLTVKYNVQGERGAYEVLIHRFPITSGTKQGTYTPAGASDQSQIRSSDTPVSFQCHASESTSEDSSEDSSDSSSEGSSETFQVSDWKEEGYEEVENTRSSDGSTEDSSDSSSEGSSDVPVSGMCRSSDTRPIQEEQINKNNEKKKRNKPSRPDRSSSGFTYTTAVGIGNKPDPKSARTSPEPESKADLSQAEKVMDALQELEPDHAYLHNPKHRERQVTQLVEVLTSKITPEKLIAALHWRYSPDGSDFEWTDDMKSPAGFVALKAAELVDKYQRSLKKQESEPFWMNNFLR